MELFNQVSLKVSQNITSSYSTSFTIGIKTLHKNLHDPIYSIYGFVRVADEIVDSFHGYNKAELLQRFKTDTFLAIKDGISTNPVLHSFQKVVNKYNIDLLLIDAFLKSMEMDLHNKSFNSHAYNEYIYGSAEVVGLMCLKVFCNGDEEAYLSLKEPARKLGSAFQKVNFLRDMKSDFAERGRVYFPGVDFDFFTESTKKSIEAEIEQDFIDALDGIKKLPLEAGFGVYVAYIYYKALLKKIKKVSASSIKDSRVRVPNKEKFALLFTSWFKFRLNYL